MHDEKCCHEPTLHAEEEYVERLAKRLERILTQRDEWMRDYLERMVNRVERRLGRQISRNKD